VPRTVVAQSFYEPGDPDYEDVLEPD
jgi:hypothetical protein